MPRNATVHSPRPMFIGLRTMTVFSVHFSTCTSGSAENSLCDTIYIYIIYRWPVHWTPVPRSLSVLFSTRTSGSAERSLCDTIYIYSIPSARSLDSAPAQSLSSLLDSHLGLGREVAVEQPARRVAQPRLGDRERKALDRLLARRRELALERRDLARQRDDLREDLPNARAIERRRGGGRRVTAATTRARDMERRGGGGRATAMTRVRGQTRQR